MRTAVLQSFRTHDVPAWVTHCMATVRAWAERRGYAYRFMDDALFALVPDWFRDKAGHRPQVISDLGRLLWAKEVLERGEADRVLWLDADTLIVDAGGLTLPDDASFAFGREVWVQEGKGGTGLKVYRSVHNAASLFARGNPFLDFYIWTAQSILRRLDPAGGVPPQVVGPKLLTALHNMAGFPLLERFGALSPLVLRDLAEGGGPALERFRRESPGIGAVNVCLSLAESPAQLERALAAAPDLLRTAPVDP